MSRGFRDNHKAKWSDLGWLLLGFLIFAGAVAILIEVFKP
jgi:uncharacterized membrane protein